MFQVKHQYLEKSIVSEHWKISKRRLCMKNTFIPFGDLLLSLSQLLDLNRYCRTSDTVRFSSPSLRQNYILNSIRGLFYGLFHGVIQILVKGWIWITKHCQFYFCVGLWYGNWSVKPFWLKGIGVLALWSYVRSESQH